MLSNVYFEYLKRTLELGLGLVFLLVGSEVETVEVQSVVKVQPSTAQFAVSVAD